MKPDWLDTSEYPFTSHYLQTEAGKMHYVDEGRGDVILFVHGMPSWSFLFRNMIRILSAKHRCVALDHIGFGLSDKPENWSYTPEAHAHNLEKLIDHLKLKKITLVVHDFGGPVSFFYAIKHPENINAIVMLNTWMWSLEGNRRHERTVKHLSNGPMAKFLCRHPELPAKLFFKSAFGDANKSSTNIFNHYLKALGKTSDQVGAWTCIKQLMQSGAWYNELWENRHTIQNIPTLILWAMQDKFINTDALNKWRKFFHQTFVIEFDESSHFLPEEKPEELSQYIYNFMKEEKLKKQGALTAE